MDNLVLIAAIGSNNELGKDNKLIWYLPNDLKFFKEKTSGHPIIMGANTFKSLPRLLPGRKHIVLTHQDKSLFPEEVDVFHSKEELLADIKKYEGDVFVIGGASIYKAFIDDADKMLLTEIEASSDADVYFPSFDKSKWDKTLLKENSDNGIKYKHLEYRRIKSER